jgi:pimeloyl-ACP methyl ester carboxylesterase
MPTLLLIPGLGSDSAIWRRTIVALGDAAICQVGDTLRDQTLPKMAARILAQAPKTFAVAGVSMGGMVAMEIMKLAPERVSRLALVDTNARPDTLAQKAYRTASNFVVSSGADFQRLAERSLPSLIHPDAAQDVRDEMVAMSVRVGAEAYVRQNRAVMARKDLRPVLTGISIPTAVIIGEEDRLTPMAMSQEINGLIPGSTLHVISDCGHLPPIEKPEALAAILRTWIATDVA